MATITADYLRQQFPKLKDASDSEIAQLAHQAFAPQVAYDEFERQFLGPVSRTEDALRAVRGVGRSIGRAGLAVVGGLVPTGSAADDWAFRNFDELGRANRRDAPRQSFSNASSAGDYAGATFNALAGAAPTIAAFAVNPVLGAAVGGAQAIDSAGTTVGERMPDASPGRQLAAGLGLTAVNTAANLFTPARVAAGVAKGGVRGILKEAGYNAAVGAATPVVEETILGAASPRDFTDEFNARGDLGARMFDAGMTGAVVGAAAGPVQRRLTSVADRAKEAVGVRARGAFSRFARTQTGEVDLTQRVDTALGGLNTPAYQRRGGERPGEVPPPNMADLAGPDVSPVQRVEPTFDELVAPRPDALEVMRAQLPDTPPAAGVRRGPAPEVSPDPLEAMRAQLPEPAPRTMADIAGPERQPVQRVDPTFEDLVAPPPMTADEAMRAQLPDTPPARTPAPAESAPPPGPPTASSLLETLQQASVETKISAFRKGQPLGGKNKFGLRAILDSQDPVAAIREAYQDGGHDKAELLDVWHEKLTGQKLSAPKPDALDTAFERLRRLVQDEDGRFTEITDRLEAQTENVPPTQRRAAIAALVDAEVARIQAARSDPTSPEYAARERAADEWEAQDTAATNADLAADVADMVARGRVTPAEQRVAKIGGEEAMSALLDAKRVPGLPAAPRSQGAANEPAKPPTPMGTIADTLVKQGEQKAKTLGEKFGATEDLPGRMERGLLALEGAVSRAERIAKLAKDPKSKAQADDQAWILADDLKEFRAAARKRGGLTSDLVARLEKALAYAREWEDRNPGKGDAASPRFNPGSQVQPDAQLPAETLQRVADKITARFPGAPRFLVQDSAHALTDVQVPTGEYPSGGVVNGKAYLFRDGVRSIGEAEVTVFHELFHLGVVKGYPDATSRRQALLRIALKDPEAAKIAAEWRKSVEAAELRQQGHEQATLHSISAEEALASIAERIRGGDAAGSKPMPKFVTGTVRWLASMADFVGLPRVATRLRRMTWSEAERFVVSTIDRLREGGPGQGVEQRAFRVPDAPTQTDTPEFRRWFGASKAVDSAGAPMVMYHGTGSDITQFRPRQADAIFVSPSPDLAGAFANMASDAANRQLAGSGAANVTPLYVRAEKPFDIDAPQQVAALRAALLKQYPDGIIPDRDLKLAGLHSVETLAGFLRHAERSDSRLWLAVEAPAVQRAIRGMGHDGFYVYEDRQRNLAVYSPTQLKSAIGNRGTFDPENPDIRYRVPDAPAQTDTTEFRRWFGGSKVVGDDGKPLVVYHGTNADFDTFKRSSDGKAGAGIYMTGDASYASLWNRGDGANVMPVYVSLKNPIVLQQADGLPLEAIAAKHPDVFKGRDPFDLSGQEIAAAIRSAGFDGVIQQTRASPFLEVMALDPEQIKSAIGNRGTFDPANPDIRYRIARRAEQGDSDAASQLTGRGIHETAQATIRSGLRSGTFEGFRKALHLMTTDQIVREWGDKVSGARDLLDAMNRKFSAEYSATTAADNLLRRQMAMPKRDRDALADLQFAATRAELHPDQPLAGQRKDPTPGEAEAHRLLAEAYAKLSPEAKAVYGESRKVLDNQFKEVVDALRSLVKRVEPDAAARRERLKEIDAMIGKVRGPYFPLARFGDFVTIAKNAAPDGRSIVEHYESAGEQERARQEMIRSGVPVDRIVMTMRDDQAYQREVSTPFVEGVRGAIEKSITDPDQRAAMTEALNELIIRSLPAASGAKNFIRRRNVEGFSQDAARALADSVVRAGRYVANLQFTPDMNAALAALEPYHTANAQSKPMYAVVYEQDGAQKVDLFASPVERLQAQDALLAKGIDATTVRATVGGMGEALAGANVVPETINDIVQKAAALRDSTLVDGDVRAAKEVANHLRDKAAALATAQPEPRIFRALGQLAHIKYLGLSPAYWLTNLAQVPTMAFPHLSGRYGVARAASALGRAGKTASIATELLATHLRTGRGKSIDLSAMRGVNADERAALQYLADRGQLDITQTADLAHYARGESPAGRTFVEYITSGAHYTEVFNRIVTGLAAYRLARDSNVPHQAAMREAMDAVSQTQFNYAEYNKPMVMQARGPLGPPARLFFMFQQYAQNTLYWWGRNVVRAAGKDPAARKEATRAMGAAAVGLTMMGGIAGLPLAGTAHMLLNMLGQLWADDPGFDVEREIEDGLKELGADETVAKALMRGVFAPAGIDLSERIGQGDLLSKIGLTERQQQAREMSPNPETKFFMDLLGPVASMGADIPRAIEAAQTGDMYKLFSLVPVKGIADIARAKDYMDNGVRAANGDILRTADELSALDVGAKALGFTPTDVQDMYRDRADLQTLSKRLTDRRGQIARGLARGLMAGDDEAIADALDALDKFNASVADKYPSMVMTGPDLESQVKRMLQEQVMLSITGGVAKNQRALALAMQLNPGLFSSELLTSDASQGERN